MKYKYFSTKMTAVVLILLILTYLFPVSVFAADATAPKLVSYESDKTLLSVGEVVTFTVEIEEENPKNYIYLHYIRPDGVSENIEVNRIEDSCIFEGAYTVTEQTVSGIWVIDYISIGDTNSNHTYINNSQTHPYNSSKQDLSSLNFEVVGTSADTTAPKLISYDIDKTFLSLGEVVTFTVEIEEESPKSYIYLHYIRPGGVSENIELKRIEDTCVFEGTYTVTEQTVSGVWVIDYISIGDTNNNYTYINNSQTHQYISNKQDLSSLNFEVVGTSADTTAPKLVNYNIDKAILSLGEIVTFTVEIEEENPKSYIYFHYIRPGGVSENIELKRIEDTCVFEGTYTVTEQTVSGVWVIDYISIGDTNNNYTYINNSQTHQYISNKQDLSSLNFEVADTSDDVTNVATNDESEYIVIFRDGYGTTLSTQRVSYGDTATAPTAPSNKLYLFMGWDSDFDYVTYDMIIYPIWKLKSDIIYDVEAVAGEAFELEVYSQLSMSHTITCNDSAGLSYETIGVGIVFADKMYYSHTYSITIDTVGSYILYVTAPQSSNILSYTVRVSEKEQTELGDVNLDSKVNIKDATAIQKQLAGLITLSDSSMSVADFNKDTQINIKDATAIQKFIAGIDTDSSVHNITNNNNSIELPDDDF